ncbi:unnamed protein product [Symbiodinium natans]|uniref:Uncharacterized protein n=1 Tax=Symbiodinium natans TaxID=878477 RepID=A0A812U3U8_9DINO|nr:unnamed protein product [Symbiodinium natans]
MVQEGPVNVCFTAQSYGVDVAFDPQTQEQLLSFRFGVTVSLPQLLQQLIEIQKRDAGAAGSQTGGTSLLGMNFPSQQRSEGGQGLVPPYLSSSVQAKVSTSQAPNLVAEEPPQQPAAAEPPRSARGPIPRSNLAALDVQLLECVQRHETHKVTELLKQRADVNFQEGSPYLRSPLHLAVENGGTVDEVGLLLQAAANVNAVMAHGKTPLHVAIQQYRKIPTVAIGMLLCSKANTEATDSSSRTPMDLIKQVFGQLSARGPDNQPLLSPADSTKARQLLSLVMDQRMVAFNLESQEVQGVHFADTEGDKIVFDTKSGVGLYSIKAQRTLFFKNLKQKYEGSVYNVAVNPEAGTVAACLRFMQAGEGAAQATPQTVIVMVIWPNGQLQHEEPLKLRLPPTTLGADRDLLPPMVTMSRTHGTSIVIGRLADGQVFCWQLNSARSQLVSEAKLAVRAGALANSDDCSWVCLANKETGHLDVFMLDQMALRNARLAYLPVAKLLNKRPLVLAMQTLQEGSSCLVAFGEDVPSGQQTSASATPIEVSRVSSDGGLQTVYRVPIPSACNSLSFCYKSSAHLLCSCTDGLQLVFNLLSSETSCAYDNPGIASISISTDQSQLVSSENNFFKVYKVPAPTASSS